MCINYGICVLIMRLATRLYNNDEGSFECTALLSDRNNFIKGHIKANIIINWANISIISIICVVNASMHCNTV